MTGVEAEWDPDNGRYKLYTRYRKEIAGDDIGAFLTFNTTEDEQIEVQWEFLLLALRMPV